MRPGQCVSPAGLLQIRLIFRGHAGSPDLPYFLFTKRGMNWCRKCRVGKLFIILSSAVFNNFHNNFPEKLSFILRWKSLPGWSSLQCFPSKHLLWLSVNITEPVREEGGREEGRDGTVYCHYYNSSLPRQFPAPRPTAVTLASPAGNVTPPRLSLQNISWTAKRRTGGLVLFLERVEEKLENWAITRQSDTS